MGNRKIYIVLIVLGLATGLCGILMKLSRDPALHKFGLYLGWTGIAVVLFARIFFGRMRGSG